MTSDAQKRAARKWDEHHQNDASILVGVHGQEVLSKRR